MPAFFSSVFLLIIYRVGGKNNNHSQVTRTYSNFIEIKQRALFYTVNF